MKDEFLAKKSMVKWEAQILEGNDNTSVIKHRIGVHPCTPQDWKKFHAPAERDKSRIAKLQSKNSMHCLDANDKAGNAINNKLFGADNFHKHRRLEINFVTCEPKQLTVDNFAEYDNDCLVDKNSQPKLDKKFAEI